MMRGKLYLDAEDNLSGHTDPSFTMPSIEDHSCPACDEALHLEFGQCVEACPCECHYEEAFQR